MDERINIVNTAISRRHFIATGAAALAVGASGIHASAQNSTSSVSSAGGIGWPREVFNQKYGPGTASDDLVIYANPTLDGSELSVLFVDEIAMFIDVSIPEGGIGDASMESILQSFLPDDAHHQGSWGVPSVDGTPYWGFQEFHAESMNMAGSGATLMMISTAYNDNLPVRATISLAIPDGADQFAPAEDSIGPGSTTAEWQSVYGKGTDGHAAAGSYDATWFIEPWDKVVLYSQTGTPPNTVVMSISAISAAGVDPENAMEFSESILPQSAQLQAGYSAYPVPDRPQGWGVSTWTISKNETVLLFMLGAGDDSGSVLQVASVRFLAD